MEKYTQKEQTEIIQDAMILTATINYQRIQYNKLQNTSFREMPKAPVMKKVDKPQVVWAKKIPKPTISFQEYKKKYTNGYAIEIAIGIILFVASSCIFNDSYWIIPGDIAAIAIFSKLLKRRKKIIEKGLADELKRLENTPEYKNALIAAELDANKLQKEANAKAEKEKEEAENKYKEEKNTYDTITLPQYKQELDAWQKKKNEALKFMEEEIRNNEIALRNLYETTKIISEKDQNLDTLEELYSYMKDTEYTYKEAASRYESSETRRAINNMGTQLSLEMNSLRESIDNGFKNLENAMSDNNVALEDLNGVMHNMRHENNKGNLTAAYQRWAIKKEIKNINKKLS